MPTAIRAESLSKQYVIGALRERHDTLRDVLSERARRVGRRRGPSHDASRIWALRDVSFEVEQGEMLGIIGRNGAGKSTLLKILTRITKPTQGRAEIYGRVASLLEVGTGFHPELTGRQNVFLNGSILGMRRAEISRRFDEIVSFADVERFIDTPVKRFSSGMYMRLAFAVAAHLETDILLVDEVLAVGDAEFQKRCLGKMGDVARSGRTVLLVSHNMHVIGSFCDRAILLESGRVALDGSAHDAVRRYLAGTGSSRTRREWEPPGFGNELARLVAVEVASNGGAQGSAFLSGDRVAVVLELDVDVPDRGLVAGFDLVTLDGTLLFRSFHTDPDEARRPTLRRGRNVLRCTLPTELLNEGSYAVNPKLGLHPVGWFAEEDGAVQFDVFVSHGTSSFQRAEGSRPGALLPMLEWELVDGPGAVAPSSVDAA